MKLSFAKAISAGAVLLFVCFAVSAQTSAFKFDGKLIDNGPAEGQYDFVFRLFDLETGGTLVATEQTIENVQVNDGQYSVELRFGFDPFTNVAAHWLEVAWRPGSSTGAYTTLAPRHHIVSVPYAMQSAYSTYASNANAVGGVPASRIVNASDPRLSDARNPLPGSSDYIQNTVTQQPGANFNVSGNGTAGGTLSGNTVDAGQYFSLAGNRILSTSGFGNLSLGRGAGGSDAGDWNTFVGQSSGGVNTTGQMNAFFGGAAGLQSTSGRENTFIGSNSGWSNTTGTANTFVGQNAGHNNVDGWFNTAIGTFADVTGPNLFNATAIGTQAKVSQSNSLVLGAIRSANSNGLETNVGIGTTAPSQKFHVVGTSLFNGKLQVIDPSNNGLRVQTNAAGGTVASFGGFGAFQVDAPGISGGRFIVQENGNTGLGTNAPTARLHVAGNSVFNGNVTITGTLNAPLPNSILNTTSVQPSSNFNISGNGIVGGNVGIGTTNPFSRLDVRGDIYVGMSVQPSVVWQNAIVVSNDGGDPFNNLRIDGSGNNLYFIARSQTGAATGAGIIFRTATAGWGETDRLKIDPNGRMALYQLASSGTTQLCRNDIAQISYCSSSARYKDNIADFRRGLDLIDRLRPVSFDWKTNGQTDMGLVAEEVADIEPLLATFNETGEVEGVKYDRVAVVLVNAVKEQQRQIDAQQKLIEEQRAEIESLKRIVCTAIASAAAVCRKE